MWVLDEFLIPTIIMGRTRKFVNTFFQNEVRTMGKKIMILNGSPRAKGNTAALIQAFTKGAEEAGHAVTCFDLQKMDIHPCLGCCGGGKDPAHPCVQRDDMEKIYPVYKDADIVCLASPMYYWTVSGQLKCAFDRLFAVAEGNPGYANPVKDCTLLVAAEGHEFEETEYWYDNVAKHLGWTDKGKVLCGGVFGIGDIEGNAKLQEAYELGKAL